MFKSLGMLWVGLSVFFQAFEQMAKGLLSLFTAGAEMAAEFEDEARAERIAKRKSRELLEGVVAAPSVPVAKVK